MTGLPTGGLRRVLGRAQRMVKSRVRPVISNTRRTLGVGDDSWRSPPAWRSRFSAETKTLSAVESTKVTAAKSTTIVVVPSLINRASCSRSSGAVLTSSSPAAPRTVSPSCSVTVSCRLAGAFP